MSNGDIGRALFDEFNCHYVDLDKEYTCSDFNNKNNFKVIPLNIHNIKSKAFTA